MFSFQRLLENMNGHNKHLDSKAMDAIRTGINVDEEFWDNFLSVINNADALSALLDVPHVKISGWHVRIREYLDKVRAVDDMPDPKKRGKLLSAGNDDPFAEVE